MHWLLVLLLAVTSVFGQTQTCSGTKKCPDPLICNFTNGATQEGICIVQGTNTPGNGTTNTTTCQSTTDCISKGDVCNNGVCEAPTNIVKSWLSNTQVK